MGHAAPLKTPAWLAIVGHSGAGKTTLIEALLPLLVQKGLRVATLKHSHHAPVLDTPNTDSWRHKQAGTSRSLFVTPTHLQLVADLTPPADPETLIQTYCADMDLVLAEGFSNAAGAKIEVLRRACNPTPRCTPEQGLIARVSDQNERSRELASNLPVLALDDAPGIVRFILQWKAGHDC